MIARKSSFNVILQQQQVEQVVGLDPVRPYSRLGMRVAESGALIRRAGYFVARTMRDDQAL